VEAEHVGVAEPTHGGDLAEHARRQARRAHQRAMPDFPCDYRQDSLFLDSLIVHCRIASGLGLGISDENPVELATV
jgi:hypothetical protein